MKERFLTGLAIFLVIASVLLTKIVAGTTIVFDVFVVLLAIATAYEMSKILSRQGKLNHQILMMIFPVALFGLLYLLISLQAAFLVIGFSLLGLVVLFVLAAFLWGQVASASTENEMREHKIRTSKTSFAVSKAFNTLLGCIYPTMFLLLLMPINHLADFGYLLGGEVAYAAAISSLMIGFCFAIPFICDTFAYLIGKTVGGPKLCPNISPKKTIAGAIGGVISTVVLLVVIFLVLSSIVGLQPAFQAYGIEWWLVAILGFVGAIFCTAGDLFESILKRKASIKDSGNALPGHGGFLDRIDGLLFVVPVVAIFTLILLLV